MTKSIQMSPQIYLQLVTTTYLVVGMFSRSDTMKPKLFGIQI